MVPPPACPTRPTIQRAYPQSGSQKPGCGFPLLRLVGVFSLSTGALLDYARGDKHQHELGLLRRLMHLFKAGDVVLAAVVSVPIPSSLCY
jgi:hypothetical protein